MSNRLLSPQQKIVMQYLIDGYSLKKVAELMSIRRSTIGKYIQRVIKKTEAKSLLHCIAILVARGEVVMTDIPECIKS